jgi:hypothetical protein
VENRYKRQDKPEKGGKRKEERGRRKEERGRRKEEGGKGSFLNFSSRKN